MVFPVGEPVAMITYPGDEQQAAMRLARVGSDNVVGYLTVDRDGAFPAELMDLVQPAARTTAGELGEVLDNVTVIDVRNPAERELGAIPGSHHIPLAQLRTRLDEVPTEKPLVVHCAGGWRSSVAASLLRANGFNDVSDLTGGYHEWAQQRAVV
jgi:hydroxyacylglutathione hydrolase